MPLEQQRNDQADRFDSRALGESFEAHNSQSYGGDLGDAFAAQNEAEAQAVVKRYRHRRSRIWVIVGVVLIVAIALLLFHQHEGSKTAPAGGAGAAGKAGGGRGQNGPAAITAGKTQQGDMPVYVNALGTVTPVNTISLYSQVTGKVLAVYYKEGQLVHKGQPLIDIDPRPYQATLAQAKGTLLHDQGVLAQAQIDLKRYQDAWARNAIARQQLEDQEQAVLQDQGTIATDQASIDYDQVQLSYCHIVSPINGRVGLRLVDPGNTVFSGTGSTLVVITQLQPITVVFNVSEDDLPRVQAQLKGRTALTVDAYDRSDDKIIESGTLSSLDNEVDTTTGTVKFRATFPNYKDQLFPNQFINAHLLVQTLQGSTLVPTAAVQHNGTQAFVYVVRPDDTVAAQNITAETSNDQDTAVTGINPGVTVATSGFDRLENGAQVHVGGNKAAAAPATPGGSKPAPGSPAGAGVNGNNGKGTSNGSGGGGNGASSGSKAP